MDGVGTAILVTLTLVAIGIVIDRLRWLKKWLNTPPPGRELPKPPEPPK